jgi:diaminopimelate epimerase
MCGTDVTVDNPGGALHVNLDGDEATLSGPVEFVANIEWLEA